MRRIVLYTVSLLLSVVATVRATELSSSERWERGNEAYANGDYAEAIKEYKAIADGGEYSFELYYNLGNAYFKSDSIGKAILYYNKALRIEPSQEDARHNLARAEERIAGKVEEEPEFFLTGWLRSVRNAVSCTTWSVLSLVSFALFLAFVLLFLLASRIVLRKTGFYSALCALLLFVATIAFAISSRNAILRHDEAIVITSGVWAKSSPDHSANGFELPEGTKVRIVSEEKGWYEVMRADGKKGWLLKSDVEQI